MDVDKLYMVGTEIEFDSGGNLYYAFFEPVKKVVVTGQPRNLANLVDLIRQRYVSCPKTDQGWKGVIGLLREYGETFPINPGIEELARERELFVFNQGDERLTHNDWKMHVRRDNGSWIGKNKLVMLFFHNKIQGNDNEYWDRTKSEFMDILKEFYLN